MNPSLPVNALVQELVQAGLIRAEHAGHMLKIFAGKSTVGQVQRMSDEDWRRLDLPPGLKQKIRAIAGQPPPPPSYGDELGVADDYEELLAGVEPEFGVSTMAVNAMLDALDTGAGFLDQGGWQDQGMVDQGGFDQFDNAAVSEGWQEMSADDPLAATGGSDFGIPPVEDLEMFMDPEPAPAPVPAPAPSRAFPAARAPGRSPGLAAAAASKPAPPPAQPSRGPGAVAVAKPVQRDAAADLLDMMAEFGIEDTTVTRSEELPPAPAPSRNSGVKPKLPPPPPASTAKPSVKPTPAPTTPAPAATPARPTTPGVLGRATTTTAPPGRAAPAPGAPPGRAAPAPTTPTRPAAQPAAQPAQPAAARSTAGNRPPAQSDNLSNRPPSGHFRALSDTRPPARAPGGAPPASSTPNPSPGRAAPAPAATRDDVGIKPSALMGRSATERPNTPMPPRPVPTGRGAGSAPPSGRSTAETSDGGDAGTESEGAATPTIGGKLAGKFGGNSALLAQIGKSMGGFQPGGGAPPMMGMMGGGMPGGPPGAGPKLRGTTENPTKASDQPLSNPAKGRAAIKKPGRRPPTTPLGASVEVKKDESILSTDPTAVNATPFVAIAAEEVSSTSLSEVLDQKGGAPLKSTRPGVSRPGRGRGGPPRRSPGTTGGDAPAAAPAPSPSPAAPTGVSPSAIRGRGTAPAAAAQPARGRAAPAPGNPATPGRAAPAAAQPAGRAAPPANQPASTGVSPSMIKARGTPAGPAATPARPTPTPGQGRAAPGTQPPARGTAPQRGAPPTRAAAPAPGRAAPTGPGRGAPPPRAAPAPAPPPVDVDSAIDDEYERMMADLNAQGFDFDS